MLKDFSIYLVEYIKKHWPEQADEICTIISDNKEEFAEQFMQELFDFGSLEEES